MVRLAKLWRLLSRYAWVSRLIKAFIHWARAFYSHVLSLVSLRQLLCVEVGGALFCGHCRWLLLRHGAGLGL